MHAVKRFCTQVALVSSCGVEAVLEAVGDQTYPDTAFLIWELVIRHTFDNHCSVRERSAHRTSYYMNIAAE